MITPTVGRVVLYYPENSTQEQAALIASVVDDHCVNLAVAAPDGHFSSEQNVPLIQLGEPDNLSIKRCCWMPFQVGQSKAVTEAQASAAPIPAVAESQVVSGQ